ncbi:MAG TPA: NAD(P)/FAD-dependent oxidoreductase [Fimbriimonas sp.]|nr:NAD(P)/FAD-dependent oxidoreductase [Fimbriimonas sp.]
MERLKTGVAIVGGGPAGTTVACLLKKYAPQLDVTLLEKERFPRDHVGESQLPAITWILEEMGVWDKVEAAGFPIKLGGTYRWGATDELWHLNFIEPDTFENAPRPGKLTPQRRVTAFQIDRSKFDTILLDHAEEMGCRVLRETPIKAVRQTEDFILGLTTESQEIKAQVYVDASGEAGILRKALQIEVDYPTTLRNIAFYDYWEQADWAERIGDAATRIQVMSLGWGWLWFIPILETRTSIGLVLPAEHYKKLSMRPEEIYLEAVQAEPMIRELTQGATREGRFTTTKDWNFLTGRLAGENWYLVGDSCGFADPILSAGMTLAHTSGRKVAYSILEGMKKRYPAPWIRQQYSDGHRAQIRHHMRFAEFWYAGNGRFTDLHAYCAELAESAGLKLEPEEAFRWLGTGGFALDTIGVPMAATFPMGGVKTMTSRITGVAARSTLTGFNVVERSLEGVHELPFASYERGEIRAVPCLTRGTGQLPKQGAFALLLNNMGEPTGIDELIGTCIEQARKGGAPEHRLQPQLFVDSLEALEAEGWIKATYDASKPESKYLNSATAASR